MRSIWLTTHLLLGSVLLAAGLLSSTALLLRLPASQAVDFASIQVPITPPAHHRAVAALERAVDLHDSTRFYRELGFVHHNFGRQPGRPARVRDNLYERATNAFASSLRATPVDPIAWLLVAQMHYERGQIAEAATAFEWSLRTGYLLAPHVVARSFLGLGLWPALGEETRDRLVRNIAVALEQRGAVDVLAAWAVEAELDTELAHRLGEVPDAEAIARDFATAAAISRANRLMALARLQESSSMSRRLAAASIVLMTGLPAAGQAMTIADYLASARGDPFAADSASVNEYLLGALDGLVMLGAIAREEGVGVFCPPDPDVLAVDLASFRAELDAMFAELETEVPGFAAFARTRSLGLAALQVLVIQHPCDD